MIINVYLICAEIEGKRLHKIGFTKRSIEKRIREFRTGNASELYLVDSFSSKWGTKVESHLHRLFRTKKVRGEWFDLTDEDLYIFKDECQKVHDNMEFINKNNTWFIDNN